MKVSILTTVAAVASADIAGQLSTVSSLASGLSTRVEAWNSHSGLLAALGIQGSFPGLVSAVSTLSSSLSGATDSDIDPVAVNGLISSVVNLLNALTAKAADFNAVGAGTIVKNDITSVQGAAFGVVSEVSAAVAGDCAKIQSLTAGLDSFVTAFSNADVAYGAPTSSIAPIHC